MNLNQRQAKKSIQLQELCQGIIPDVGNIAVEVSGLCLDSRRCQSGDVFLAYPGALVDGRDYIVQAIEKGATAVIYEQTDDLDRLPASDVPMIAALHLQQLIGDLAFHFHHDAIADMRLIGITGTNGKTSIAYLIAQAMEYLGHDCAYIGTLGMGSPSQINQTALTTADAVANHQSLVDFYQQGTHACAMEVSSHALDQGRVNGIPFKTAVFTNLSHDHLDYHKTMQAYGEAKARLLAVKGLQTAVINLDDDWARGLLPSVADDVDMLSYSLDEQAANIYAINIQYTIAGIDAEIVTPWGGGQLVSPLLGHFNLSNLLAVIACLVTEGHSLESVLSLIPKLKGIPGRMECLRKSGAPLAIVDYAHTPDALEQALKSLKQIPHGRLYCVFGCGGDRDREKRSEMGKVAQTWANKIVLTNDNPRRESPQAIIDDIMVGIGDRDELQVITDRKAAIEHCLQQASSDDVIRIAGKGHEDYQLIGDDRFDFSDQAVVRHFWGC